MIKIGPFSARHLTRIRLKPTRTDYMLWGASLLLCAALWGLAFFFHNWLPAELNHTELFKIAGVGTIIMAVIGFIPNFASPCSFNYPVPVTEQNLPTQYFLAIRFIRVMTIIVGAMMILVLFNSIEVFLSISNGVFDVLIAVSGLSLIAAIIVYLKFARKYR